MGTSEAANDNRSADDAGSTTATGSGWTDSDTVEGANYARWYCALLGGLVGSLILPLFPVSLATGGAVGGYLRKGDTREGITVGALAGLPPTVPVAIGALYVIDMTNWRIGVEASGDFTGVDALYIAIILLVFIPAIFAILSAVGGALGVHLDESF